MSKLVDPRNAVGCACPRLDGKDCIRVRTRRGCDDFNRFDSFDDERCECSCHDFLEDDDEDQP